MAKKLKIPFDKLSKADQRRTIAKDVLGLIALNTIKIDSGDYLNFISGKSRVKDGDQVNKVLGSLKCRVCAKGALFLGHIDRFNSCKIEKSKYDFDFEGGTSEEAMKERLKGIFSPLQLDMIEAAFEKQVVTDSTGTLGGWSNDTRKGRKSVEFGKNYHDNTERLIAILENIVKNGSFKP